MTSYRFTFKETRGIFKQAKARKEANDRNRVLEEAAKICREMPCECCWHEDAQIMADTCAAAILARKS